MAVHNPAVLEFPASPEIVDEIGKEQNAEVAEWIEAFNQVVDEEGKERGTDLIDALVRHARKSGVDVPVKLNTPYVNTIPVEEEQPIPAIARWNAGSRA